MRIPADIGTQRKKVLKKAMLLFLKRGIKDVTMDELAHELSMSKRTLYELYADKEELLLTGITAIYKWHHDLLKAFVSEANNVLEIILYDFELKFGEIDQVNPNFFIDIMRYEKVCKFIEQSRSEYRQSAINALTESAKQGHFRTDINFALVYDMINSFQAQMQRQQTIPNYPMSEVIFNTAFLYLRGCATPLGMEIIDNFLERRKFAGLKNANVISIMEVDEA